MTSATVSFWNGELGKTGLPLMRASKGFVRACARVVQAVSAKTGVVACGPRNDAVSAFQLALLKRDLRKASKLARMQPLRFLVLQPLQRLEADLEMLADALAVEFAGHAGKLDLAV